MKMRDLEAATGVNRETIRVYLRHGLVPEPLRPKPNVADYQDFHIRAVLAVRDLQKNNGLTLKQIKSVLNGQTSDRHVEAGAFQNLEALVAARVGVDNRPIPVKTLQKAWPHAESDALKFASIGIVDLVETKDGPCLSVTDTRLVTIWGEMREAGLTEERGFTPEMLSFYLEPANTIATQEANLFLERTEGKIDEDAAAAILQTALRGMLDFFGLLRVKFFLQRIHRENHALVQNAGTSRRPKARPNSSTRKSGH